MTSRQKKWLLALLLIVPLLAVTAFLAFVFSNPFGRHLHCIKNSGLALRLYATDNHEKFPYSTNGFGDALLLLVKSNYCQPGHITGPGDDNSAVKRALQTGSVLPESECTRIYIQGLSENGNPDIAILFDKHAYPGGDHSRRPWGPPQREVCMLDGSMQIIHQKDWPQFVTNQIQLLIQEGIAPATAARYYQLP